MSREYADYVEARYQGEVFGELVFEEMAKRRSDPEEVAKLRVLARLERETKELLEPEVAALGRSTTPEPDRIEEARTIGAPMGEAPWLDILGAFQTQIAPSTNNEHVRVVQPNLVTANVRMILPEATGGTPGFLPP